MSGERGSGLLGAVLAVAAVCALLGLAADLTIGLWSRSSVEAAAEEAARRIARRPDGVPATTAATVEFARARRLLGPLGTRVGLELEHGPGPIVVHLRWEGRRLLPALVPGGPTVTGLDRRIAVRREGAR